MNLQPPLLRPALLAAYNNIDTLLDRLPTSVSTPVRREFDPLKNLFLLGRTARICFVVDDNAPWPQLLAELTLATPAEFPSRLARRGAWFDLGPSGRDIRVLVIESGAKGGTQRDASTEEVPDAVVLVPGHGADDANLRRLVDCAADLVTLWPESAENPAGPLFALLCSQSAERISSGPIADAIGGRPEVARRFAGLHGIQFGLRLRPDGSLAPGGHRDPSLDIFIADLAREISESARVSLARATSCRALQHAIIETVTRTASTVAGVIGAQPIPLADLPLLTALQIALIGAIVHTSGKPMNPKLAMEFTAAAGFNIAGATLCRTCARLATKLLPGWGNAISAGIAAGGTMAVSRAASAFFIDDRTNRRANG